MDLHNTLKTSHENLYYHVHVVIGEWQISILYDGEHIRGSPFSCFVYDANLVQVYGLDVGVVGQELKFNVNSSQAGRGDLNVRQTDLTPSVIAKSTSPS